MIEQRPQEEETRPASSESFRFVSTTLVEEIAGSFKELLETARWCRDFLTQPNQALGRPGPVCPYSTPALSRGSIWMTVVDGVDVDERHVVAIVSQLLQRFFELAPQSGEEVQYKAVLALFPNVPSARAPALIDQVQNTLKPKFVKAGLMIGEFHALNETPGLHNADFRPLRSPVPMLAIRYMVDSDLPFLMRSQDQPSVRAEYLKSYVKRLGHDLPISRRLIAEEALKIAVTEASNAS